MSKKLLFILIIAIAAILAAFLLLNRSEDRRAETTNTANQATDTARGFIVSENSIYVADQTPGKSVDVAVIRLGKPGFIVIHEDRNGAPGAILSASALVAAGDARDIRITTLSRPTKDGELLYAMLHADDGDGVFDTVKDAPLIDPVGNEPVMTIFVIVEDAEEPDAVNL